MRWTVTIALVAVFSACGGNANSKGLSQADLEAARAKVHGFQPWDQAETLLEEALGDPTTQDDDALTWIARDGDTCHALRVARMAKTVGTVTLEEAPCP